MPFDPTKFAKDLDLMRKYPGLREILFGKLHEHDWRGLAGSPTVLEQVREFRRLSDAVLNPKPAPRNKPIPKRIGRPPEYNWKGAWAYLARSYSDRPLPPVKARVLEDARIWFIQ